MSFTIENLTEYYVVLEGTYCIIDPTYVLEKFCPKETLDEFYRAVATVDTFYKYDLQLCSFNSSIIPLDTESKDSLYNEFTDFPMWRTRPGPGCYPVYENLFGGSSVDVESLPTDSGYFSIIPKMFIKDDEDLCSNSFTITVNNIALLSRLAKAGDVCVGGHPIITSSYI